MLAYGALGVRHLELLILQSRATTVRPATRPPDEIPADQPVTATGAANGAAQPQPAADNSADQQSQLASRPDEERDVRIRMALVELLRIGPNAKQIAERIGVPRATLLGWAEFRDHYDRAKANQEVARQSRRRGRPAGERDFKVTDEDK